MIVERTRFTLLDGMRGVAAFGVMFYHLWFNSKWFSGTNTFVDFFFVLSGFVLAPSLSKENGFDARKFITKRLMRLYPMLVPVFVTLLISDFPYRSGKIHDYPHSFATYLGAFLLLQIFWGGVIPVNTALWSLSAEWFVNLLSVNLLPTRKNVFFVISFGVGIETLGLLLNHKYHFGWGVFHYLIAVGRALVGFYLGLYLRNKFRIKNDVSDQSYKLLGITILAVVNFFLFALSDYFIIFAAPIFYFVILHISKYEENKFPNYFLKACRYLGRISYGVYVWHLVIFHVNVPSLFIGFIGWSLPGLWLRFFNIAVTISLTILATELSIIFFEIPIRRIMGKYLNQA